MWRNIIGQSIYQLAVLAVLNFDGKQLLKLSGSDATDILDTVIFNSFVFCQVCGTNQSGPGVLPDIYSDFFLLWISISSSYFELIFFIGMDICRKSSILVFCYSRTG